MHIINIADFKSLELTDLESESNDLRWIDITRPIELLPPFIEKMIHSRHRGDLSNSSHPPFFEQTESYELLIVRTIDDRFIFHEPKTRSCAFIIYGKTIITVHDKDASTFNSVYQRWLNNEQKKPREIISLLHSLLDEIGKEFLSLREPLTAQISEWQQKLLDPNDPFNDWQVIMQAKSRLRGLTTNLELQRDVLSTWKQNTQYELTPSHIIRFNDLDNHLARIERLSTGLGADLESLTQIYFASTGQRTNVTVQILAVISAIFLPLNLIAGIFGMNFEIMPFQKYEWGAAVAIGLMLIISVALLWWFKKKKWY